jgi:hypothetical protein
MLFGPGPGLNFDFSRFSFHVPTSELLWANSGPEATTAKIPIATNFKRLFICVSPYNLS